MRGFLFAAAASLAALAMPEAGEAKAAEQVAQAKPMVVLAYYKVPPNRLDDWLDLFKAWHLPVLNDMKKNGEIIDAKFYSAGHRRDWDFLIVITRPPLRQMTDAGPPRQSDEARARRLFGDYAAFQRGEAQRWALTVEHWDDILTESSLQLDPGK